MSTEQQRSHTLRIQLVESISQVDLPWFLLLEIDTTLSLMNFFKLSNLWKNIDTYIEYLHNLSNTYTQDLTTRFVRTWSLYAQTEVRAFLTDSLQQQWFACNFCYQELHRIESFYRVTCLLQMKEYIYRRKYNTQRYQSYTSSCIYWV